MSQPRVEAWPLTAVRFHGRPYLRTRPVAIQPAYPGCSWLMAARWLAAFRDRDRNRAACLAIAASRGAPIDRHRAGGGGGGGTGMLRPRRHPLQRPGGAVG